MRVISRKKLRAFWEVHPEARPPLENWFRVARQAGWRSFTDVRATLNSADFVEGKVVFNVGGNKYRLIAAIHYNRQKLYIRHVLTHEEYSSGGWKHD